MSEKNEARVVTARAFSGEGIKTNKFCVESDGRVLVWDSVAGHYTTCHSLSAGAVRRIRKLAWGAP